VTIPKSLKDLEMLSPEEIRELDKGATRADFPKEIKAEVRNPNHPEDPRTLEVNVLFTSYVSDGIRYGKYRTPYGGTITRSFTEALRAKYTNG
jgi:hypothetical protein